MTRPLLLAVMALVSLGGAAAAADVATKTFDGWTATCDNVLTCVAIGTAQDDLFYVRIARTAGAGAPPEAKIVLAAQEPQKGTSPAFALTATTDGAARSLGSIPAKVTDQDASILSAIIAPGEPSLVFIDGIRNAGTLDYSVLTARGSLELKGLAAALRFIDAAQGRQGTPTALVARGMTPVGQVPPAPAAPVVATAPAGSASAVDKPGVPKALIDLAAPACDPDVVKDQSEAEAWRLASGKVLFALACTQGAYNLSSALYLADADGGGAAPVALPRPPVLQADAVANVVVNASFDPKTMRLVSFEKGRGLGDCGTSATWVWDGHAFELLEASMLEACPGALPEDWPSVYTAREK